MKRAAAMYDTDDLLDNHPRRELERLVQTRCRAGLPFALLLIELDGFSGVSKRYGAHVGDLLLYEVTSRIRGKLEERDLMARSGTSEFAVLVLGMENVGRAEQLARDLIERLQRPIAIAGTRFSLSASVGISLSPRQSGEWRLLLEDAESAAVDAKTHGRGHVSIAPHE